MLRNEGKLIAGLKSLQFSGDDLQEILSLNVDSEQQESYALDIRDDAVVVSA